MADYQATAAQLRARRRGRPGELALVAGAVLLAAALFAFFAIQQQGRKLAGIKTGGVVAEAVVRDKAVASESYTDRKGGAKTRNIYRLTLSHDINAELAYADWKAGQIFPKPAYPAVTTTEIETGQSWHDAFAKGDRTTVIRVPSDYSSMMLTDELEYESSGWFVWLSRAAAALGGLAGLALIGMGWRKRRLSA